VAKNPLFSTYKQGENRVTSSMLAVFERMDLSLLETILQEASGESSLQMVSFLNQPPGKGHSVPDALISARFAYYFEVKTARHVVSANQLSEHLASLTDEVGEDRLFVITPDPEQPAKSAQLQIPGSSGSTSVRCTFPGGARLPARPPRTLATGLVLASGPGPRASPTPRNGCRVSCLPRRGS